MVTQTPAIAQPSDGGYRTIDPGEFVSFIRCVFAKFLDQKIDFGSLESGDGHIEIQFDRQLLEFEHQQLAIPPSIFRKFIVGNNIRADLGGGQMINADGRDVVHAD